MLVRRCLWLVLALALTAAPSLVLPCLRVHPRTLADRTASREVHSLLGPGSRHRRELDLGQPAAKAEGAPAARSRAAKARGDRAPTGEDALQGRPYPRSARRRRGAPAARGEGAPGGGARGAGAHPPARVRERL